MIAGFLDTDTDIFTPDMEINCDDDIDVFMEKHDLLVVMMLKK